MKRKLAILLFALVGIAAAQTISGFTCASTTIAAGGSVVCTFTLSAPAAAGFTVGPFATSDPAVFVGPSSVPMASGSTSATVTAMLVSGRTPQGPTVSVIPPGGAAPWVLTVAGSTAAAATTKSATIGSITIHFTLPAAQPAQISLQNVTCDKTTLNSGDVATCTVTLSGAAPAGGFAITPYSADSPLVLAPASLVVPSGASSTTLTVTRPAGT